jgi:hypothetical protein
VSLTALAAALLSSAQDGHWKGHLSGGEKAAKVTFKVARDGSVDVDVATCGGHDTWTARRASR